MTGSPRLDYAKASPGGYRAMLALEAHVASSGFDRKLLELIKTRASQINSCAFCIDMHSKDARHAGESEQRLYGLSAWREAPYYTARERAALAWTEAVTRLDGDIGDDLYDALKAEFSDGEIADLTFAIVLINGWNWLAVPFRVPAGTHTPGED
ncbi:MAG: carboxymuconolactone decarboxylase family protein [Alphaproteobacteria bacterium]|nr:carboxymuconolactone decarboxylase family protein [Alphaproteobacteria bacterium]